MSLTPEQVRESTGFDVGTFVKKVKDEIGVGRVRLNFDGNSNRAHAHYEGNVCAISLPTRDAIKRSLGFDDKTAVAKMKAGLTEELCHCREHETDHSERVVSCTIDMMQKHLTQDELNLDYIKEKQERLKRSPQIVQLTPIPS